MEDCAGSKGDEIESAEMKYAKASTFANTEAAIARDSLEDEVEIRIQYFELGSGV
jgi:hypothetical protein